MHRIVVTGPNGAGKSHAAARLAHARPDVPLVSFDAIKLRTGWRRRPRAEVERALRDALGAETWILEGGPTLLPLALPRAHVVVWLDPPEHVRAWWLLLRPWMHRGRTRPELPAGNVDWIGEQYRFALRSLRKGRSTRAHIARTLRSIGNVRAWRCRTDGDVEDAVRAWAVGAEDGLRTPPRE